MRNVVPIQLEMARVNDHPMFGSSSGMEGVFMFRHSNGTTLAIISSGVDHTYKWEHVSVSTRDRTPTWEEMSFVKDLFWTEEECVVQFHPPKSEYVNHHPHCLHLWRPLGENIQTPPSILVGPK
jgi:hypothetical protein